MSRRVPGVASTFAPVLLVTASRGPVSRTITFLDGEFAVSGANRSLHNPETRRIIWAPDNLMPDAVPSKRFRVAFSFAGEKREFVAGVARILADRFDEEVILYDKFHKAEFSRPDLAFDLPRLYRDSSDLIVAVLCPDYGNKEWCGLEWRAIFDLVKKGRTKEVMLTRFGRVEADGLFSLAGYTDLDDETAESAAITILQRLAINEGKPKDHYTKPAPTTVSTPRTSIPHNLPALQPFFGREEELEKIAEALDAENRTWGVMIEGDGGMGKTSLLSVRPTACRPDLR